MNILVIGSNGREHALAEAYAKSKKVNNVVMTPGNGLTDFTNKKIKNYPSVAMMDFDGIVNVCKKEKIDLVDVPQDDIIGQGFVDKFKKLGFQTFGPTQKASQIEWDKKWARAFMVKYNLPVPHFKSFTNHKEAEKYVHSLDEQVLYVKASGLIGGKGAIRAENKKEAVAAIRQMAEFGKAGETFLIEECLVGEEFSLFAMCDGKNYQIVSVAQDHKTVYECDKGPNTGGMGCVAPAGVLTAAEIAIIEAKILRPFMVGMEQEKRPYSGVLYLGGMLTKNGVKIIEFNARWGDPEAEVILPSITTDYLSIAEAVTMKQLNNVAMKLDGKVRISIAGCSRGYPTDYSAVKGKEIFGLEAAMKLPGISIYGAGIKREGRRFFANGGRIFHLVAEGETIVQARVRAYGAMATIQVEGNNLHYRTDIGWRDVMRMYSNKNTANTS
ncbi:MAG: phosphoribosylamine--glycine ligase [Candidatus Levybacteria bacterium]|nr:phosphoribosylamine--glycine ligase [Candidatus Levybacteria bacterium]